MQGPARVTVADMGWLIFLMGLACGAAAGGAGIWLWLRSENARVAERLAQSERAAAERGERLAAADADLRTAQVQLAQFDERVRGLDQRNAEQRALLESAEQRLREAFGSLAGQQLQQNNQAFLDLAAQRLAPVNQLLEQYKAELKQIEEARARAYRDLSSHLQVVKSTQESLSRETAQLVQALRRPQGRGQWGELTLRRLLEMAGLADRCSFIEQVHVDAPDGRQRPDCVVKLPEGRDIVIDAKAVLDAFLDAAGAADEEQRRQHLKRHARQVRSRVEDLARREYWAQFAQSADFVVLFLPGEAFLYAAVEQDPTLIEDALRQHVLIASPTSLLGLLRVVEHGWRQQQIEANAREVQRLATELYKRIATLADHFEKLGAAIGQTVKAYNGALGSMETRVIVTARKMAEMGVAADGEVATPPRLDAAPREPGETWRTLPVPTQA